MTNKYLEYIQSSDCNCNTFKWQGRKTEEVYVTVTFCPPGFVRRQCKVDEMEELGCIIAVEYPRRCHGLTELSCQIRGISQSTVPRLHVVLSRPEVWSSGRKNVANVRTGENDLPQGYLLCVGYLRDALSFFYPEHSQFHVCTQPSMQCRWWGRRCRTCEMILLENEVYKDQKVKQYHTCRP